MYLLYSFNAIAIRTLILIWLPLTLPASADVSAQCKSTFTVRHQLVGPSLGLGIAWASLHERIVCESILMQKGDVGRNWEEGWNMELEVSPL